MVESTFPAGEWEVKAWTTAPGDFPEPVLSSCRVNALYALAAVLEGEKQLARFSANPVVVVSVQRLPLNPPYIKEATPMPDPTSSTPSTWDGSYPPPIPTWTPDQGDPAMTDAQALDYLVSVLGDQASSYGYVLQAAMVTVLRTGRKIVPVTGD